jgi:hypothetical protein
MAKTDPETPLPRLDSGKIAMKARTTILEDKPNEAPPQPDEM